MEKPNASTSSLKRTLGLLSLIAAGVGMVVGQSAAVAILQGVGTDGTAFMVAILIAFFLTLGYIFTFTELSLMMPKAGGISTYTEVAIGHFPAITVTLAGYLGIAIFAGASDLFLLNYTMDIVYPGVFTHFGLWLYLGVAVVNLLGIQVFATTQNLLAYIMLAVLLVIAVAGISSSKPQDIPFSSLFDNLGSVGSTVLPLTVLALLALMGMEFVCPLIEETKAPETTLPRAMILSAVILLVIYGSFALAAYRKIPGEELVATSTPHLTLIQAIFGRTGNLLMAGVVVTAAATSFNVGFAGMSRMLYGMAKNNQMPKIFSLLHPTWRTPWFGILFICGLCVAAYFIFLDAQGVVLLLVTSCAFVWLLVYIVAHIDLIVLRRRYPDFPRTYRSPWYPFTQIVGIIAMVYLLYDNSPSSDMARAVYLNAGLITGLAALYAGLWIKLRMKKSYFKGEPIENIK
jgi:amino acid transporter